MHVSMKTIKDKFADVKETRGRRPKWNQIESIAAGECVEFEGTYNHALMAQAYARAHGIRSKMRYNKMNKIIRLWRL